ncbi:MAG: hypothetical protein ACLR28_10055 [Flavonifractor plautii]
MQSFFRRLAACAALFCANPLAFLRGLSNPDSPVRRLLRRKQGGAPVRRRALLYYRS